jgi:hypothetical protein
LTSVAILLREKRTVATLIFSREFPGFPVQGKIGGVLSDAEAFEDVEQCVWLYLTEILGSARLTPYGERLLRFCSMAKATLEELLDKLAVCKCECHVGIVVI